MQASHDSPDSALMSMAAQKMCKALNSGSGSWQTARMTRSPTLMMVGSLLSMIARHLSRRFFFCCRTF